MSCWSSLHREETIASFRSTIDEFLGILQVVWAVLPLADADPDFR